MRIRQEIAEGVMLSLAAVFGIAYVLCCYLVQPPSAAQIEQQERIESAIAWHNFQAETGCR